MFNSVISNKYLTFLLEILLIGKNREGETLVNDSPLKIKSINIIIYPLTDLLNHCLRENIS